MAKARQFQKFILCADDFGFTPGVSEGILELVSKGRLSAVSCMATTDHFPDAVAALTRFEGQVDIGLHVVLTDLPPLGDMPSTTVGGRLPNFGTLAKSAIFGRLDLQEVAGEVSRQLGLFEDTFGRPPDFIDGHHHVHQLPGIGEQILDIIEARLAGHLPYVRGCREPLPVILRRGVHPFRTFLIGWFGGAFVRKARARGVPVTGGFSGIYDFAGRQPYDYLFDRFTQGLRMNSLIMCHPGFVDDALTRIDSLTTQRKEEFDFLNSERFLEAMEKKNLSLGRFEKGSDTVS